MDGILVFYKKLSIPVYVFTFFELQKKIFPRNNFADRRILFQTDAGMDNIANCTVLNTFDMAAVGTCRKVSPICASYSYNNTNLDFRTIDT